MPYLELTVGVSSSGKSTYAKQEVKKSRGILVEVNRDNARKSLFAIGSWGEYKFNKDREDLVTKVNRATVEAAVAEKKNVIISDTNLSPVYRKLWQEYAASVGYEYRELWFNVDLEELQKRNKTRGPWKLDADRVAAMHSQFVEQFNPEVHTAYTPDFAVETQLYEPDISKPNAVMFDTDGTTAHMHNRGPFEWDKVGQDLPKYNVINHAKDLKARGITVINLSGRDGVCKEATAEWYKKVGMPNDFHFQREAGDQRPDDVIKKELFFRDIAPHFNVLYCVDDRKKVVDMWRSLGLECWEVQESNF
ncbi:PseT polynucleotide 5'-kinase and 3'-phosphatase [Aeromonas phage phiAS5]|uniref:PseT polynucleotide 5'-kinase and 3'-phosphatase n=1 Tax=Aeromonas phage phiAS5 TaxID=879630 RepID=E1A2G1_9CAUD|nr:polynucleotide kinase [Aeromonas phage phiAS5]ADM79907.1 PseT polynucleotide 5'-kinase and 3'-phosphatase [Aeromonas phage phiAS5]BES53323.1 hypothetical protein [Aeromonas phage phiWae14]